MARDRGGWPHGPLAWVGLGSDPCPQAVLTGGSASSLKLLIINQALVDEADADLVMLAIRPGMLTANLPKGHPGIAFVLAPFS